MGNGGKNVFALDNSSVVDWLLEENQPSIRYLTLTELLGTSQKDHEVQSAKNDIVKKGWAFEILEKQKPPGYWIDASDLYFPKYIATNWMLLILSDLGLTKEEVRIEKACKIWMERFGKQDGGFDDAPESKTGHLCITGNMVRALLKFGYLDDPRVNRALDWLVENQLEDGGWDCFDRGNGFIDAWEPLSAFAAYAKEKWTRGIKSAVERGAEFYLARELHREGDRYEPWYRFHYPVHYYYDLLVGLDFMTSLGYSNDKRLGYGISLLKQKRRSNGRWNLDSINPDPESPQAREDREDPKNASIPFGLENPGESSKMVTLRALSVLKRTGDVDLGR